MTAEVTIHSEEGGEVFDGKSQILKRATELTSQARVGATRLIGG